MLNYTEAQLDTLTAKGSKKNTKYFFLGDEIDKNTFKKLIEIRTTMHYGTPMERQERAEVEEARRESVIKNLFEVSHETLTALGFTVEATSGKSVYYAKEGCRVRVSDHEVPMTEERAHNAQNGGFTWAGNGIVLWHGMDAAEFKKELVETYGE